jgi:2-methylcitrate dehydratase PrpD
MADASMGTDAHFFESALHSLQALIGTEMAAAGLVSNPDLASFAGLYPDGLTLDDAGAGLSERWLFEAMWIKKYPACFLVHRQIDALLEILQEHGLSYADIESVEVLTGPGEASCDRPEPKTVGDLQFSFQHALGVAMLTGTMALDSVLPSALENVEFAKARATIGVAIDRELSFSVAMREPTSVTVKAADGREFVRTKGAVKGSPEDPLSREEFSELYRRFASAALSGPQVERTLEIIWSLDELSDIGELTRALTFPA